MSALHLDNLKQELQRLCSEEEQRKREYYGNRADLQEIWDKLVSLRTHINKFESEIENAKIEDIMRGAGSTMPMDYASSSHRSMTAGLSLESAGRLADINKLKEKLRTKDVLRGRIAILEDKILDGRRQLAKCTDAMKSGSSHYLLSTEQYKLATAARLPTSNLNGSPHKQLTTRQALLAISENITEWEDELRRARNELKAIESEMSQEITNAAQHNQSFVTNPSVSGTATNNLNIGNLSSAPISKLANTTNDDSVQDLLAHGPPLSSDLANALRQGVEHIFDASNNRTNTHLSLSECEFSLHEVMSGQASIVRINGEAPKVYISRLQRRLGSLLTLELQIQLEFQAKVTRVKQARDVLREVEIKRLRVELQVSNLQQTLATIQSTQPSPFTGSAGEAAVEESLRRYESRLKLFISQLNTPTSKLTLPRTVSDLTNNTVDYMPNESFVLAARGQAVTSGPATAKNNATPTFATAISAQPVPSTTNTKSNNPPAGSPRMNKTLSKDTTVGNNKSPNRPMRFNSNASNASIKSPARSRSADRLSTNSRSGKDVSEGYTYGINNATTTTNPTRSNSTSPNKTRATTATTNTTTGSKTPTNTATSAPTYTEASSIAADILSNILKQQTRPYTSPYAQRSGQSQHSLRTPSPHSNTKQKQFTPSTAHIHHQIVQYMKAHNLDPQVHYTGIIKAIKIHVLSTLLSNDLSRAEVQDTVELIQSSPMRVHDGSNRLHRYFNNQESMMSPIPLPAEYNSHDHTPNAAHSPITTMNTTINTTITTPAKVVTTPTERVNTSDNGYSSSEESVVNVTNVNTLNNILTTSANSITTSTNTTSNKRTSMHTKASAAKINQPKAKSASSKSLQSKRWQSGTASVRSSVNSVNSSTDDLRGLSLSRDRSSNELGILPLTNLHSTQTLHQAVAALSETYNEHDFTTNNNDYCLNQQAVYPKGHQSVRKRCSCPDCQASAEKDDTFDPYKYSTQYNRHGHHTTSFALQEAPSAQVFTENDINILADSPTSKNTQPDNPHSQIHKDDGNNQDRKNARGSNVSFHLTRAAPDSVTNSPDQSPVSVPVSSPSRIPQRSLSHSPPRTNESPLRTQSPPTSRSPTPPTRPTHASTNTTTGKSNSMSPSKYSRQSPGRRWSDPLHYESTEVDTKNGSTRNSNNHSPERNSRPPRSRHSIGGTTTNADGVGKHASTPTKVVRKNTYQSASPIRENPRFNTKFEPPQIFVSEVFNSPSVKLTGNDGDVPVQNEDIIAKRNYVRDIFSSPVRAHVNTGMGSNNNGVLSFPSTYFRKSDGTPTPSVTTASSPIREKWLAENAGKSVAHRKYCLICSAMANDGKSAPHTTNGDSCPHTKLFEDPTSDTTNNNNNRAPVHATTSTSNTNATSSGFAGSLFEQDVTVEPSRVRLMSRESFTTSPKTTNTKPFATRATPTKHTKTNNTHNTKENDVSNLPTVSQERSALPPPLPHEFSTTYPNNNNNNDSSVRNSTASGTSQSAEYQQLLQMLASQQKEIEALRATNQLSTQPVGSTQPDAAPSNPNIHSESSAKAHTTHTPSAPTAVRSVSDGSTSLATHSDGTSQSQMHRLSEGQHQPLSVAKPRLGGSSTASFHYPSHSNHLHGGYNDNVSRDSHTEVSTHCSDVPVSTMHARRAVRPTSLGGLSANIGQGDYGIGGGISSRKEHVQEVKPVSMTPPVETPSLGTSNALATTINGGAAVSIQPSNPTTHLSNHNSNSNSHTNHTNHSNNHTNNTNTPHRRSHTTAAVTKPSSIMPVPHFTPSQANRHPARTPNLLDLAENSPHYLHDSEAHNDLSVPLPLPFPVMSQQPAQDGPSRHDSHMHGQTAENKQTEASLGQRHRAQPVPHPPPPPPHTQALPVEHSIRSHQVQSVAFDPTGQLTLRCLHERIEKLKHKYETARAHEIIHPHLGVAINSDGTSKAYVDVNIIAAKNLPEMKIMSKRCDAYIETQLITQLPLPHNSSSHNVLSTMHIMRGDTSTFVSGYVYNRMDLLCHAHHYAQLGWPAGGVDAHLLDAVVDDVNTGVQYHSYSRTSVQPDTLFPEWREFFKITQVTQLSSQYLCFTVRDSAYMGHEISADDPIIGFCVLPLTADVLRDQHPHTVWLPLQQPGEHKHSAAHRLRDDCALKVEIKVHFSEQQFWLDLQRETESILHKITTVLSHPHTTHAHSLSYQNAHGGSFVAELTLAERRKVEKWVETMNARPATASQSQSRAMSHPPHQPLQSPPHPAANTVRQAMLPMDFPSYVAPQPASASAHRVVQESHSFPHNNSHHGHRSTAAGTRPSGHLSQHSEYNFHTEQDDTSDIPLSLHMDFPPDGEYNSPYHEAPSTTSSVTQSPYNPAYMHRDHAQDLYYEMGRAHLEFQTPGGLASRHYETQPTPTVTTHMRSAKTPQKGTSTTPNTLRGMSKESLASFVRPTAETRAALKYTGLREENNRDVFYKSLRSSTDTGIKSTTTTKTRVVQPRSQQSIAAPSSSARTFTAETFFASQAAANNSTSAPPALPYESKGAFPTAQHGTRLQTARKDEPELTRERAVSSTVTGANTPAGPSQVSRGRTGSAHPPPLPAQLASNGNKIDLSIFKRARTDVVYQGEMRNETSNKLQQSAANTNEKVGFMSGKQRQLKF